MKWNLFFLIFICGACSIQKRHFQPGWDVQWKKHYVTANENKKANQLVRSAIVNEISSTYFDSLKPIEISKSENYFSIESTFHEGIENSQDKFFNTDQASKADLVQYSKKVVESINLKEEKEKVKSEDSSESNFWSNFLYLLILVVLLVGGIFLLVFGTHWSLIVLGILSLAILVANLIFWVYIFLAFGIWIKIIP